MSRKIHYPAPKKKYHRGTWEIYWNWNFKRYSIFPGFQNPEDGSLVESDLRQIALALASPNPVFPDAYANFPAVSRYMADRFCVTVNKDDTPDMSVVLGRYETQLRSECSPGWHNAAIGLLKAFAAIVGDLSKATPAMAQDFLHGILAKGNSPATRNRALGACGRFYKWAREGAYFTANPFDGMKSLKEREGEHEISYCTRGERDRIIIFASATDWPDWIAVPIAFYTGMRKEEISRMDWKDILFDDGRIMVPITKTKKKRVLPMQRSLRNILETIPPEDRKGSVVKVPSDFDRLFRLETLYKKIRKINASSWSPIPEERIGWNAWRHTFGSLLAQEGISLDKISAWMGNTPEVCRRHYAQFVPRDRHDEDIEKLG